MSIVVFYLYNPEPDRSDTSWLPHSQAFSDQNMAAALALCQTLRKDPRNAHVCISSELREMVGIMGVASVENGRTPDGHTYEWSKAARAGATRRR